MNQENELMMITTEGIIIRIPVEGTALLGRVTSGVKLINLDEGVTVASIAKVREDKSIMENSIPEPEQLETEKEEKLVSNGLEELIKRAEEDAEEEEI